MMNLMFKNDIISLKTQRKDTNMKIIIPENVNTIINTLEKNGFEAYIVGGCVRDSILKRQPNDWDICTSASPSDTLKIFSPQYHVIETGLRHGTVTIVIGGEQYEVTTFRIDGEYSDNRRPDSVKFTKNINDDLARRDFTINAMAYNDKTGIIDLYDGFNDYKRRLIRSVGDAKDRFEEDSLRILRAVRFASQLDFDIEQNTSKAVFEQKNLLKNISAERINVELCKTLTGVSGVKMLDLYKEVFAVFIPEIKAMFDFEQHNFHHIYDVWGHTVKALESAPNDLIIKLSVLFHDIGKPSVFFKDENGVGHFYGHAKVSADMTDKILKRLRFDNNIRKSVHELIYYHDSEILNGNKYIKRWLAKIGEIQLRRLLEVKRSDTNGLAPQFIPERIEFFNETEKKLDEIISQKQCFTQKELAVNGKDLIAMGVEPGKTVGVILNRLLKAVIDDKIENEHDILMKNAREIFMNFSDSQKNLK